MATVEDLDIDPALEDLMLECVKIRDRYGNPRIDKKLIVWRKRNYKELESLSQIIPAADQWDRLSSGEKSAWDTAASYCGLTGYQLFIQDTAFRILNGLLGFATPNIHHQYKVMEFITGDDCEEFYLFQTHPPSYWVYEHVPGTKNTFRWVEIEENIAAPFLLEFDYRSQLEATDAGVEYYVIVFFDGIKNGVPDYDAISFNLDLVTDWQRFSEELNPDLDTISEYWVEFDAVWVSGWVQFDNFNFFHDGQNWAFDPRCDNIDKQRFDIGLEYSYPWELDWGGTFESFDSIYID